MVSHSNPLIPSNHPSSHPHKLNLHLNLHLNFDINFDLDHERVYWVRLINTVKQEFVTEKVCQCVMPRLRHLSGRLTVLGAGVKKQQKQVYHNISCEISQSFSIK